MTARVLIVDDNSANRRLLEARLTAEYFTMQTASNGADALAMCSVELPDVILLDVMMPGMDGFEVCRQLKSNARTQHVPVVMVTALDQSSDLLEGLEAGADDFLTKPVDNLALITRIKNLARFKVLIDEMLLRAASDGEFGLSLPMEGKSTVIESQGRVLVVEDREAAASRIVEALRTENQVFHTTDPAQAVLSLPSGEYDLIVISLSLRNADGLRLCSEIRSLDDGRHLPLLALAEAEEQGRLHRALDMGVNDYIVRPVNTSELLVRVRTQIKRKRYTDYLRSRLEQSVELAVLDPLTTLHNRRYFTRHMQALFDRSVDRGRVLSILLIDVDRFKFINDTHGHDAGDDVLRALASRLRDNVRASDLACRLGGEEFVVVMPDTSLENANLVGERLRHCIAAMPFMVGLQRNPINVTSSIGVAALEYGDDRPELILRRADQALYSAKRDGRNRVAADAA
jgi:two-component system, cell cycle response regulator